MTQQRFRIREYWKRACSRTLPSPYSLETSDWYTVSLRDATSRRTWPNNAPCERGTKQSLGYRGQGHPCVPHYCSASHDNPRLSIASKESPPWKRGHSGQRPFAHRSAPSTALERFTLDEHGVSPLADILPFAPIRCAISEAVTNYMSAMCRSEAL